MAASSVTGTGYGDVDGYNKGSEHHTMSIDKLIGTRIVASGSVTLSGGAGTVTFPQSLPLPASNYIVFTQDVTATAASRPNAMTNDSAGNFASFTVAGTTTDVIKWIVVKL